METRYNIVILFKNLFLCGCKDCYNVNIELDELTFDSPYALENLTDADVVSVVRNTEDFSYTVDLGQVTSFSFILTTINSRK